MNRNSNTAKIKKLEQQLEDCERENYQLKKELKNVKITIDEKVA